MFLDKRILLVVPDHVGFPDIFKKNLEYLGYNVSLLTAPSTNTFKYKNIFQRVQNFTRKIIFKDRDFKHHLFLEQNKKGLLKQLQNIKKVDFALIIRADHYPIEVIEQIKLKSKRLIAYQWDGLERYPLIYKYIPLIDRFYVFDENDLSQKNTLPLTNFYFDYFHLPIISERRRVFYLGSYTPERLKIIKAINKKLELLGIERSFKLISNNARIIKAIKSEGIEPTSDIISYEENLKEVLKSTVILDIQDSVHNGLSFRIFEGIGYDKKVITTNVKVKNYDFYHPNNFLIWDGESVSNLEEFLAVPFHSIPTDIKKKYSFSNWFSYITEQENYIPFELPHSKVAK